MVQTRGYNPEKHSALPYVDKPYRALFNEIAALTSPTKKHAMEQIILHEAQALRLDVSKVTQKSA